VFLTEAKNVGIILKRELYENLPYHYIMFQIGYFDQTKTALMVNEFVKVILFDNQYFKYFGI
jgi:hypothetical protein